MKLTALAILLLLVFSTGCRKLVEVDKPGNLIDNDQVFAHDSLAEQTMAGAYARIMSENNLLNGNLTKWAGLYCDDITRAAVSDRDSGFLQVTLTPAYFSLREVWNKPYQYIFSCNSILEGVRQSGKLSPSLASQIEGEALFLRAICYFYLVNLFGDVPLVTGTNYSISASMPRTDQSTIYDTIVANLTRAMTLLPATYPGTRAGSALRIRANSWTARALLSRVSLYRQQWQAAATNATAVIQSGLYQLCNKPDSVFKYNSPETLLQLQPITYTAESIMFSANQPGIPTYEPTAGLLSAFEQGDLRKSSWLPQKSGVHVIRKYQQTSGPAREYNVLLRLTELYLIRAEALLRMNNVQEALSDINTVRQHAGLLPLPASDKNTILLALAHERRSVFFAELGHRFLDLKRWMQSPDDNDPLKIMAMHAMRVKPHWNQQKNLWPIPASEISANNLLVQNPGY